MLRCTKVGFILYVCLQAPSWRTTYNESHNGMTADFSTTSNDTRLLQLKETITDCCAYWQVLKRARASAKHDYIITYE